MSIFIDGQHAPLAKIDTHAAGPLAVDQALILNSHLKVLDCYLAQRPNPLLTQPSFGGTCWFPPKDLHASLSYVRAHHPDPDFVRDLTRELKTRVWQNPNNL